MWIMVVKINVTYPFCVGRHVGIDLNTFVRTNARKSLVTFELPLLWFVIENGFQSPVCGNRKFLVAIFLMCHYGFTIYMK